MSRGLVVVEVKGLKQALANLERLPELIAENAVKKASRAGGNELLRAVRGNILQGLTERTGLLRKGLAVSVGRGRGGNRITAYVKELEVKTAGTSARARAARGAAFRARKGGGMVAKRFGAFYWRFLELGTADRKGHGALRATGNVGAAFTSSAGSAIDTFRRVLLQNVQTEVSKLPK